MSTMRIRVGTEAHCQKMAAALASCLGPNQGRGDTARTIAAALAAFRQGGGVVEITGSRPHEYGTNRGGTTTIRFCVEVAEPRYRVFLADSLLPEVPTKKELGVYMTSAEAEGASRVLCGQSIVIVSPEGEYIVPSSKRAFPGIVAG